MADADDIWEFMVIPPPELVERISAWLEAHHSMGVVIEEAAGGEPVFEPGQSFQRSVIKGYFAAATNRTELDRDLQQLVSAAGWTGTVAPVWSPLVDRDWQEAWKEHWLPMAMGRRLLVQPTWLPLPQDDEGRLVIRLDPEMAFGSGSHETTRGCLEALERLADGPGLGRVLDLGTGSGILAIAALLLGAESVLATDCDPVAVATTERNALLNLSGAQPPVALTRLTLRESAEVPIGPFDTVVANLLTGVLLELAPAIGAALAPGGCLILSGILAEQGVEVAAAYQRLGLKNYRIQTLGDWVTLEAVKPVIHEI